MAFLLSPVVAGRAPAFSQDFSITNQPQPADAGRRDLLRQLQAWWDVHAYYPRHASGGDESGTVKVRLVIRTDGNIGTVNVVESSGSASLDAAGASTFREGFVRPFLAGVPEASMDFSLHYILTHRHDGSAVPGYVPSSSQRPFTIMNDPISSPILTTMLQKNCTGTVVKQGIRNHPSYGTRYSAQAIFFRRPDGTPWVTFYEGGYPILAPVVEVGKVVQWTGREEHLSGGASRFTQYTVWPDGDGKIIGKIEITYQGYSRVLQDINRGGTVDFVCEAETVPAIDWRSWQVTPEVPPVGDPP